ncbi:g6123 [Coccomyxa elongata]
MQDCNVDATIRFGNGRSLQFDSTFKCNTQKFPLYTLVVVDDHKKAVPTAFLICSQERADLLQKFLEAVTAKPEKTAGTATARSGPSSVGEIRSSLSKLMEAELKLADN